MVTALLAALAVASWPDRPDRLRRGPVSVWMSVSAVGDGRAGTVRSPRTAAGPATRFATGRWPVALGAVIVAVTVVAGPVVGAAAGIAAGTAAVLVRSELRGRRDLLDMADLLTAVRTLGREVRAGTSPAAAVAATAAHRGRSARMLDGVAAAVARTSGAPPPGTGVERGPTADVADRLIAVWALSARYGVPWAALVDTVADDLADRLRAASQRTSQVAGPKLSGYVLAGMPALGVLLGSGMGADPVHVLLHTGAGRLMLLVGVSLNCLGLAWSARIVRG